MGLPAADQGQRITPWLRIVLACLCLQSTACSCACSNEATGTGAEGYSRALYQHWLDVDHDGLDSRQQALARTSLRPVVIEQGRVAAGLWLCPYTATVHTDPGALDVDHVVPLHWAHQHGAHQWDGPRRAAYANDQDNLIPVQAGANREKGSQGPDRWLPPHRPIQREYIAWFSAVCRKYALEDCP